MPPSGKSSWTTPCLLLLPFKVGLAIPNSVQMEFTISSFFRLPLCVSTVTLDVILRGFLVACLFLLFIVLAPPFHLILWLLQTLNRFTQSGLPQWLSLSFGAYLDVYRSLFAVIVPPVQNTYIWNEQPPRTRPEVTSIYPYKPLKGLDRGRFYFRLLELLPSPDFWGPIQVRLHQGPFHQCQDYEAISYCWGDSTDTWPIYLDDQVMPIRINLAQALRRYRFQSGSRFIWADAICIDQSNLLERSYQVAMIREIYQRSQCTLIWLGPGTPNTVRGLEFVWDLVNARTSIEDNESAANILPPSSSEKTKYNLDNNYPRLQAYRALQLNPWFRRVWVIQEVALGTKASITLGPCTVDWDDYCTARAFASKMRVQGSGGDESGTVVDELAQAKVLVSQRSYVTHRLLPLLLHYRQFEATDARDKIFALCGLFPSSEYADILSPNYDVSASLLYEKAARCILTQDRTLDILGVPRSDPSNNLRVPSWVPVWIKPDADMSVTMPLRPELTLSDPPRNFCAAGMTKYDMRSSSNQTLLGVDGLPLGAVSLLGVVWPRRSHFRQQLLNDELSPDNFSLLTHTIWVKEYPIFTSALEDWREIARPNPEETYGGTEESRYDAFWQTMVAGNFLLQMEGKDAFRSSFRAWEQALQRIKSFRRLWLLILGYVKFSRFLCQIPITDILFWPLLPFYRPIFLPLVGLFSRRVDEGLAVDGDDTLFLEGMSITAGRRMVRLNEDYIALVPGETQVEDQIFLLKGGSVLVVLRQKGDNWEVIGEAYVHGVMRGELWDESRCKPMWLE